MTDRERLIELVCKGIQGFGKSTVKCSADEYIADHLLANGVFVPPCKAGDIVYVIEPCSCFCGYRTFAECHHRRTNATKWIEVVMVANKHHNRCMKLFERPYKPEYYFKIGKTVFPTKEEAERALKEREQNDR